MSTEERLYNMNGISSGDLSASQYCGVVMNSSGKIAVAAEGGAAVGILQNKPQVAGEAAVYAAGGASKVRCGGSINAGSRFTFDLNGHAVAVGSGDDWSMGVMEEAGSNGIIARALIQPTGTTI